jgi:MFS family permease
MSSAVKRDEHAKVDPAPKRPGPFTPLRQRNFSLLFSGQLISALGDQAYAIALPWTVLAKTGDIIQMAIVLAAETVPRVLLLLVGGALADRLNPRIVMLLADIGRAGVVIALGVTLFSGLPPLWIVATLAALQGAGSGLFLPGSQSILPRTVRSADIPAANGLMQMILWSTMIVGPVLGGIATAAQAGVTFIVDGASFLVSAITLAGIRLSPRETPASANNGIVEPLPEETVELLAVGNATTAEEAPVAPAEADGRDMANGALPDETPTLHLSATARPTEAPRFPEDVVSSDHPALEEAAPESELAKAESAADAPQTESPSSDEAPAEEPAHDKDTADEAIIPDAPTMPATVLPAPGGAVEASTERSTPPTQSGMRSEIGAGVAYAFGQPLMRTTMVVSVLGNLAFSAAFGVALIVLSRNLDSSPVTLGLLLGASGVGGVLGGLASGPIGRGRGRSPIILLLWLMMAAALAFVPIVAGAAAQFPFPVDLNSVNFGDVTLGGVDLGVINLGDQIAGLTPPERLLAVAAVLGLVSCIIALGETVLITILQQRIPPDLMGRVFSVQFLAGGVTQPLSLIAAGFVTAKYGPGVAFLAAAVVFFIAALIGLFSPTLRRA